MFNVVLIHCPPVKIFVGQLDITACLVTKTLFSQILWFLSICGKNIQRYIITLFYCMYVAVKGCSQKLWKCLKKKSALVKSQMSSRMLGQWTHLFPGSFPWFLPGRSAPQITEKTDVPVVSLCPVVFSVRHGWQVRHETGEVTVWNLGSETMCSYCLVNLWVAQQKLELWEISFSKTADRFWSG